MSFATIGDVDNYPYRDADGQRAHSFPAGLGLTEVFNVLPTCVGCSNVVEDAPCRAIGISIPVGEQRWTRLDADKRIRIGWARNLHATAWIADYIQNGYLFNLALNAGQVNNLEMRLQYEIVSVSSNVLTVKGKNPKRIEFNVGSLNPEWPLEANRITYTASACAMPLGAMVRFLAPSCLMDKLRPHIEAIDPPSSDAEDDVTFDITLSANVSACLAAVDAKFPAETYYCEIIWPQHGAPTVPNLQVIGETQFTLRQETTTSATVFTFTTTAGGNTRILWPDMFAGALVVLIYRSGGAVESLSTADMIERLTTSQVGAGAWQTRFDLSDYAGATFEKATLIYRPEAVSNDDPYRLQFAAHCANCQIDRTGSYTHNGDAHCTNPGCSQFATFKAGCWQPNSDGFCLGNEETGYNQDRMIDPPAEVRDAGKYWACLWNRAGLTVQQGLEGFSGTRNFSIEMPSGGGPSLEALIGGFADEVMGGLFPIRYPLFDATMGQRVKTVDDGNTTHELVHGAFYAQTEQDVSGAVAAGALPAALGEALGTLPDNWPAQMPDWIGNTSLYSYASGASSFGCRAKNISDQESYATALDPNQTDSELAAEITERFS